MAEQRKRIRTNAWGTPHSVEQAEGKKHPASDGSNLQDQSK
jgi:hypothetical protein